MKSVPDNDRIVLDPDKTDTGQSGTKRLRSEDIDIPGKAQRLITDPMECSAVVGVVDTVANTENVKEINKET